MGTRETVEAFYGAVTGGDMSTFFDVLAEDVVVTEPSFLPYGGAWKGKDGMKAMLGPAGQVLDIPTLAVKHIIVEGDRAFVTLTSGRLGTDEILAIAEEVVVRDDKITEITVYLHEVGSLVVPASEQAVAPEQRHPTAVQS